MDLERALGRFNEARREAGAERASGRVVAGGGGPRRALAGSLCVASGKGGTGKSVVAASLATLLASRGPVLLLDADLGVGNAHLLHDVRPVRSLVDVVQGVCDLGEALTPCADGVELLAAGSGVSRMAALTPYELHLIASGLTQLEQRHAFALVDSAAGLSEQTIAFAAACDLVLVVTTPDVTAMTDAYAFLKVLVARRRDAAVRILVNRVPPDPGQGLAAARHVGQRLAQVARKFLGVEPELAGWLPEDPAVGRSLAARRPLVEVEAGSPAAVALLSLSVVLADALRKGFPGGLGRGLARTVGFSTASA